MLYNNLLSDSIESDANKKRDFSETKITLNLTKISPLSPKMNDFYWFRSCKYAGISSTMGMI